jgi:hypothetical protein
VRAPEVAWVKCSPDPCDPISQWRDAHMRNRCPCGWRSSLQVGTLERRHRLPADMPLGELLRRLRCSGCGARGKALEPHA